MKKDKSEPIKADKKYGSVIVKCNCSHSYQDAKYGPGNRVANLKFKDKSKNEARCTVCGSVRSIN